MAFKELRLSNFRNMADQVFQFSQTNFLRGKNGAGKSTLKEAMAFCFAGTDSLGNKNPQHLIAWNQKATEVTILTDKATLTRRLTDKGTATIKLTRGDVTTPMTQSQIDTLIGGTDVFLCTLIPGYFFGLAPEKQQKVLTDLLPPTDRKAILQEIVGFEITQAELVGLGLNRRADLVATTAATNRRTLEKDEANLQGEIRGLESLGTMTAPVEPTAAITELGRQKQLKQMWEEFRAREDDFLNKKNVALRDQIKPLPEMPVMAAELTADQCDRCGSIVGSKKREQIVRMNIEAKEKHQARVAEVNKFNEDIEKQRKEIGELHQRVMLGEARALPDHPEPYSAYALAEADLVYRNYSNELTKYRAWEQQRKTAADKIVQLKERIVTFRTSIERLAKIEKGLGELPQRELQAQAAALAMPRLVLEITDRPRVICNGKPYESLSDGQKIDAGIELAFKFHQLRPLGVMFIENADLIDNEEYLKNTAIQWIVAKVDPTMESLYLGDTK